MVNRCHNLHRDAVICYFKLAKMSIPEFIVFVNSLRIKKQQILKKP